MMETLKTAAVDMIPQGAEWIGFVFIMLMWYQYYRVEIGRVRDPNEVHWFWTWTWTFIMVSIGYELICLIGGIFFK